MAETPNLFDFLSKKYRIYNQFTTYNILTELIRAEPDHMTACLNGMLAKIYDHAKNMYL